MISLLFRKYLSITCKDQLHITNENAMYALRRDFS